MFVLFISMIILLDNPTSSNAMENRPAAMVKRFPISSFGIESGMA